MASTVSIVIPTRARGDQIGACLRALSASDYPRDQLEVAVVEDGGPTKSTEKLRQEDFDGLLIRWFAQPHRGPGIARNLGAYHTSGDFILFTDDDCRPRPDWVSKLTAPLTSGCDVVGGHTVNGLKDNLFSSATQALVNFITDDGRIREGAPFLASNNLGVTREAFARLGGFDESFSLAGGEDRDLVARSAHLGLSIKYVRDAHVEHYHALTLKSFWNQHHRYGRGAFHYHRNRMVRTNTTAVSVVERITWVVRPRAYLDFLRQPEMQQERRKLGVVACLALAQLSNAIGLFAEMREWRRVGKHQE